MKTTLLLALMATLSVSLARAADPAPTASSVVAGTGSVKFNGLLQAWWFNDTSASLNNFRLRRAELRLSGSVTEATRWLVMIDPAKSLSVAVAGTLSSANDNKVIQDLIVGHAFTPEVELVVGQFKTQTTAEGLDSSAELPFAERSATGRRFGDKREPGAMVQYKSDLVRAGVMVSNGQATNVDDTNGGKDLSVRVDATPHELIKVGAFTSAGNFSYGTKSTFGGNARFAGMGATLRAEYVWGYLNQIKTSGLVIDGGYTLMEHYQPVLRFETLSTKDAIGDVSGQQYSVGFNYLLAKHNSKVQLSYSYLDSLQGSNGSPAFVRSGKSTILIIAFQAAI